MSQNAQFLSLDLGTTTLNGLLVSNDGKILATASARNPQQDLGADILSRMQKANDGAGTCLQKLLVRGLRDLIDRLIKQVGSDAAVIKAAAAACNPGLSCLLNNLPVERMLFPPHKPPVKELQTISPAEIDLGLQVPLQLFPPVSGFVGGDLVAVLFSLGSVDAGTLVIDIGTNGELALWDGVRWWAASVAAGPAFEAGNIGSGMVMETGAVTNVVLTDDRFVLTVMGGGAPRGLCGSGLAALVAVGREGGLIDATGRILSPDKVSSNLARYLIECQRGMAIRFYRDASTELCLTQEDLRCFQLAKGALRAGVEVLLSQAGITPKDLSQVLVTGALGTALSDEVLKKVALLPEPMLDKTSFIANGVLAGLQAYLSAADGQQRLTELTNKIQPFPLSGTPTFERLFLAALEF
jgi:uncharacterized 2Fe-2S/4Fe-4S cluster protein (DUF4445 family)